MELQRTAYLNVELKPTYFNEFITCGIPIPHYIRSNNFTLMFSDEENYTNYLNTLKIILKDLKQADPERCKYEIQRSRYFIKSILLIIKNQSSKQSDTTLVNKQNLNCISKPN